jgi:hypothetical protein
MVSFTAAIFGAFQMNIGMISGGTRLLRRLDRFIAPGGRLAGDAQGLASALLAPESHV